MSEVEQRSAAETLQAIILEHYAFETVGLPRYLEQAHQRRHRKLIVQTDRGRFLIKTYKPDPVILDALRFQHRLSDHLLANGLPVARIAAARNGKKIVEFETWALELQQFVDGLPMQVTARTLMVSARALGKFHKVCRDFPRPDRDAAMWRFSEVPRDVFARLYERAKAEDEFSPIDSYCNRIALFLQDATRALNPQAREQFETGLIHGDWHSGNLLFRKEELAAIVDLEFAGDGCYLEDLSYALSNLCIRTATEAQRIETRTNILLDNYQQYRTLSPFEERALYYAVGIKHVATVSYQTHQSDGTVAGLTASDWMKRLALQCEWLDSRAKNTRWG